MSHRHQSLSVTLAKAPFPGSGDTATVAELTKSLDDLAHSAAIFFLAALGLIPAPPGLTVLIGIPLIIVCLQKACGWRLKLPNIIMKGRVSRARYDAVRQRLSGWLSFAEKWVRPGGAWQSKPGLDLILDCFVILLAIGMMTPLPFTAMLPSACICIITLGRLETDGRWVLTGVIGGMLSLLLVVAMIAATIKLLAIAFIA